ncbi:MAG: urea ABC transporter ATP-binding subunit UrtE [Trueperaceae bacterium]|nr:urea ABC transporter ATP-binding subunit UrtE [Trueperaceae bacterium]
MLKLEKVSSAYGASQVLWDVDLDITKGEAVALLGRNGVGKTTLLKTIMGVQPIRKGFISYDNVVISKHAAHRRAQYGLAYVPQGRGIFPQLTVEENLLMGLASLTGREDAKEKTIPDYVFTLFPVLKDMLSRKGGNLSGGQQQQLAIGRALVTRPRILLLDEPTEGIQPSIVMQIEEALKHVSKELGVAVLLVEQYLDFAWSFADRYFVMQRGRIIDHGYTAKKDKEEVSRFLSI